MGGGQLTHFYPVPFPYQIAFSTPFHLPHPTESIFNKLGFQNFRMVDIGINTWSTIFLKSPD